MLPRPSLTVTTWMSIPPASTQEAGVAHAVRSHHRGTAANDRRCAPRAPLQLRDSVHEGEIDVPAIRTPVRPWMGVFAFC